VKERWGKVTCVTTPLSSPTPHGSRVEGWCRLSFSISKLRLLVVHGDQGRVTCKESLGKSRSLTTLLRLASMHIQSVGGFTYG
jgi:hypothetical protein